MHPVWRKSSRSTTQGGECVEIAVLSSTIGIRDSKNPDRGHLTLSPAAFTELVRQLKDATARGSVI
ncbi:DUF397 domain-containing protein [Actinomadura madurae]|uniref:DUF397 domain-containing protein n=1 Tax=Actinomadura madurae TaxID=1993 RepID=UPI0020261241|nr:DUF397 domain-containing protein [Actinomadura madurae]URM95125.1 DUF397 domain-containing protein [Actinomadura madurae]